MTPHSPIPSLISQYSSLFLIYHLAATPTLWQEWLFWAPSQHDRLRTISDLKGGGEDEGGGGIRNVEPKSSVGSESLKEKGWGLREDDGSCGGKPYVDMTPVSASMDTQHGHRCIRSAPELPEVSCGAGGREAT